MKNEIFQFIKEELTPDIALAALAGGCFISAPIVPPLTFTYLLAGSIAAVGSVQVGDKNAEQPPNP